MEDKKPRIGKNVDKSMSQEIDQEMPNKVRTNCKLASSWVWDKKVNDFVKDKVEGYSLNVCAGISPVGDEKVDLDPQSKEVGIADMRNLPYEDETFDTVISDPPWKIGFFQRMKPFFECVRVCKEGGRIIYNCGWRPTSNQVKLEEAIIRTDNNWSNVSVIWIFRKNSQEGRNSEDNKKS